MNLFKPSKNHSTAFSKCLLFLAISFLSFGIVNAQTPDPNPDLTGTNPLNVVLVLDESGSIGSLDEAEVQSAVTCFVNEINSDVTGIPVNLALIEFSYNAEIISINGTTDFQEVNTAYITDLNTHLGSVNGGGYNPGGLTNWEDGFLKVRDLNEIADLVIYFTDGRPTAVNNGSGYTSSFPFSVEIGRAVTASNLVKSDGTHILMVGVGSGAPISNLVQVSGTDVIGSVPLAQADYTLESNFAQFKQCLLTLAKNLACELTVTCPPADGGSYLNVGAIPGQALTQADFDLIGSIVTDNCDPVISPLTVTANDIETSQTTCTGIAVERTYTINAGFTQVTCTQTFNIIDAPQANCQNITVTLDSDGNATITANDIDNGSTDNCGIVNMYLDNYSFSCGLGDYSVTLTVEDADGQSDNCTATVTVVGDDADCDNVHDACDVCSGGDDSIDNNNDGIADCSQVLDYDDYPAAWKCSNNGNSQKVYICHKNKKTLCVNINSLASHLANGSFVGGCGSSGCNASLIGYQSNNSTFSASEVESIHDNIDLQLYPNPATEDIFVEFGKYLEHGGTLEIYNQNGALVAQKELTELSKTSLSLTQFNNGIYMMVLKMDGEEMISKRFIIAK